MSQDWMNEDDLYIKYGTAEAGPNKGGALDTGGSELAEIIWEFNFSDLAATGTEKIMSDVAVIPDNFFIKSAQLHVSTAFVGATATLSIGLLQADDRSTAIGTSEIGIDDTIAVTAIDAVGDTVDCDGAIVGTKLTEAALLTMTEGTAAFTAGVGRLVIKGYQIS